MAVQWWEVAATIVCIILSGTFSGLTLGLMSLDIIDLRVLIESGTDRERWFAKRILPVRFRGNWLLCTLLIGNTAVNVALSIITANLFGGIAGFIASTTAILYVGEIIPQSVCHRFGLVIGAYAIPLVKLFMFLTSPLSYPTAVLLNCLLGGEQVTRYSKSQLKSLLSIHGTQAADGHSRRSRSDDSEIDLAADHPHSDELHRSSGTQEDFTVVELPKISAHSVDRGDFIRPLTPQSRTPTQGPTRPSLDLDQTALSQPQSQSADPLTRFTAPEPMAESDSALATNIPVRAELRPPRAGPISRFYNLRRGRRADKRSRRERERDKREKDSESSQPPLTKDEVAMLGGAFDFSQKTVDQVMTALDDVFMLEASLSLNFAILLLIFQSGHSRVPVYDKTRDNIIGVLFAKDLILLDPEDCVPIKTVLLFFNRIVLLVFKDTPLNKMLNIFRQGGGHMAIVRQNIANDEAHGPTPATLGIVTLEDLIEELIGQDIVDETDVYTDNISKQRVKRVRSIDPEVLKMFDSKHDEERLSEKEVLAVASYLADSTEEFSEKVVKMSVLKQMLAEVPIIKYHDDRPKGHGASQLFDGLAGIASNSSEYKPAPADSTDRHGFLSADGLPTPANSADSFSRPHEMSQSKKGREAKPDITVYSRGVPTKNAYLIMSGRVEISAGNDGFISTSGPWNFLGMQALTDDLYAPDFTARVSERPARLLRISRKLYRLIIQYSAAPIPVTSGLHMKTPPLAPRKNSLTRSRPNDSGSSSPPPSLALAASATAVAVGSPCEDEDRRPMPGSASDVAVVRKSRARRDGVSIEWGELSLNQSAEADAATSDASTPPPRMTLAPRTPQNTVDIVIPLRGSAEGEPPSSGDNGQVE
eukprot:GFKZ01008803.1.p1 GENE.GFKZ01008803.1~~GFKZ01008803.1.p1  ORF type:complete len:893 (-),score=105.16 GFKZ01008803.1:73-2694(-)